MPFLGRILIIGLVYIASISENISEWISVFSMEITSKIVKKKTLIEISKNILNSQIDKMCDAVCSFLFKMLNKKKKKKNRCNREIRVKIAEIFYIMLTIAVQKDFSNIGDQINVIFEGKTNIKLNQDLVGNLSIGNLLKIRFVLMFCFSSFMMNFHFHIKSLKYSITKVAAKYDKDQNQEVAL